MNGYDSIVNIEYNNFLIEAGVRGEELPDDVVNLLECEADVCPHHLLPLRGGQQLQLPVHVPQLGLQHRHGVAPEPLQRQRQHEHGRGPHLRRRVAAAAGQMLQHLASDRAQAEPEILTNFP